jgi:hypothetical protein
VKVAVICAAWIATLASQALAQTMSAERETELKREGLALLAKWTNCRMDAVARLADTSGADRDDIVVLALKACGAEREAWIESQTALGWPRYAAEQVADGSEQCSFPIMEAQVDLTRRHATQAERQAWANAHADYSCRAQ